MLSLRRSFLLPLLLALSAPAWAQDDGAGIRQPERLTVGVSHQFLGQLTPDGKDLYFLTNRNTVREIYRQDMETARPLLLFDEGADVSWARVSPDGRRILYISFRDDAAGELCVRELPSGPRRCLSDGTRAVEAQWMGPSKIALVSRSSLQGDLRVMQVSVDRRLSARPLLDRNLSNPTVSPDGRWLIYVPVQRYIDRVGPGFAARAATRLEAVRLDGARLPQAAQPLQIDLPGRSAQPAFSLDGRSLYFVQFFSDSNRDGVIDGGDNGVLFRVPFSGEHDDAPARAASAFPEQLSDSAWNCRYPSPASEQLIVTCSRNKGLDVYSLPLDGVVPSGWDAERLRMELDLASRPVEQEILYRRLLQIETGAAERRRTCLHLVQLHLDLDEFEAAEFYARRLDAAADPEVSGMDQVLQAQIAHRRSLRARESGRMSADFVDESKRRLASLDPAAPASPSVALLRRVVRSEIEDTLGDKDEARRELEATDLTGAALTAALEAYYRRADALYRQLDDAGALWETARRLSEHPGLAPDDRLRFARAAARALVRGLPLDKAQELLAKRKVEADPVSELAFAIELTAAVLRIRDDRPTTADRDAILALYKRQTRLDRRRAVMMDAVQQATRFDAERIIEALVQLYVDDVPRGTRERRRAERLYQRFMEGRAYRRLARGRLDRAREDFALVARTTGSLESHIGYVDLRLREGATLDALEAEYKQQAEGRSDSAAAPAPAPAPADATELASRFMRAYLLSLRLPLLDDKEHEKASRQVSAFLRQGGAVLRRQAPARALLGTLMHERFQRSGELAQAQRADTHYLVALELVQRNPRYRAMVLGRLGLLHTQVGNYRIALDFLKEREALPFSDDVSGLAHQLVKAQALLHLDRREDAARAAEEALKRCEKSPALDEYRVLVLDRAALYSLSAERFARALQLYDAELPLLERAPGSTGARNRLVVHLARAAAALGAGEPQRALADLDAFDAALGAPEMKAVLRWPHTPAEEVLRSYRMLAAGLRGQAHRSRGEAAAASRALAVRHELIKQRFEQTKLDEHLPILTLVEAQLAEAAVVQNDTSAAARWLREALAHADTAVRRTQVPLSTDQLALLWFASELRLSGNTALRVKLRERLRDAYEQVLKSNDPTWRSYARLLEIYVALTDSAQRRTRARLNAAAPPSAPAR